MVNNQSLCAFGDPPSPAPKRIKNWLFCLITDKCAETRLVTHSPTDWTVGQTIWFGFFKQNRQIQSATVLKPSWASRAWSKTDQKLTWQNFILATTPSWPACQSLSDKNLHIFLEWDFEIMAYFGVSHWLQTWPLSWWGGQQFFLHSLKRFRIDRSKASDETAMSKQRRWRHYGLPLCTGCALRVHLVHLVCVYRVSQKSCRFLEQCWETSFLDHFGAIQIIIWTNFDHFGQY